MDGDEEGRGAGVQGCRGAEENYCISFFPSAPLLNQLAAQWASLIQKTLGLRDDQVSFLAYHGANDQSHINKLQSIINADWMTAEICSSIVKTSKVTARLYQLQLEEIK